MLYIQATFCAAEADPEQIRQLCARSSARLVSGTLNLRWADFSAHHLAQETGLHDATWEHTADDTPASLTLLLTARPEAVSVFSALLHEASGLDEWELYSEGDADRATPDDGNGSLHGPADGD